MIEQNNNDIDSLQKRFKLNKVKECLPPELLEYYLSECQKYKPKMTDETKVYLKTCTKSINDELTEHKLGIDVIKLV